jgi:hypothetical protein
VILETLLRETYARPQHDNDRIADLFSKLEPAQVELVQKVGHLQLRRRTISIAIAANLLLAVGASLFLAGRNNSAYAAVLRSIAAMPPTREYRIKMLHQFPLFGEQAFDAELFLDDSSRFVVHHPGWNGLAEFWVGGSPNARWIVPNKGPALTGEEQMIAGWLSKRGIPSPYLHVTTILERLSRNYKLEMLADEHIPNANAPSTTIKCQHIVGTVEADVSNRPSTIDLWIDIDSGVARKVVLTWQRQRLDRGPVEWTIELVGSPDLPDDWFQLSGHIESGRPTIQMQTDRDLDVIENETMNNQ